MTTEISVLPYMGILDLDEAKEIEGQYVYICKGYAENGIAVLISREDGNVSVRIADWDGNILKSTENQLAVNFINHYLTPFARFMKYSAVPKAMYYLAEDELANNKLRLVDVRLSLNNVIGPGMLRDVFKEMVDIQETIEITTLDEETLKSIKNKKDKFSGDLVIKCSAFKTVTRNKKMLPLYARVKR